MKICWDNLEKLEYSADKEYWYKKYKTGTLVFKYNEKCENCGEPFLYRNIKKQNVYCCNQCSALDRKFSDKTRVKMSLSKSGKFNPNFGNRKSYKEIKEWKTYFRAIRWRTILNYRYFKSKINPQNFKIGKYDYNVDHKYSIYDGFRNNVSIEIISHPCNLQILTWKENSEKERNSCITLDELKDGIGEKRR